jgi:hypothetical protein
MFSAKWSIAGLSFLAAVLVVLAASRVVERDELAIPVTHALPFAAFAMLITFSQNVSRKHIVSSAAALAGGFLTAVGFYAWFWYESAYYSGGGVNFAAAFAYLGLGGIIAAAMLMCYGWSSRVADPSGSW